MNRTNFKFKLGLFIPGTLLNCAIANAQYTYEIEKPGRFIFVNELKKCAQNPKNDVVASVKKTNYLSEWIHQNCELLKEPKGFDANVSISGNLCNEDNTKAWNYGVQSYFNIVFNYFYLENNIHHTATGWSAHSTRFNINQPISLIATRFDEAEFKTGNPSHLQEPLEKALAHLKTYYRSMPILEEIAPGVRLYVANVGSWYTGNILVFNPNRPDIWLPVTVEEIMQAQLDYYQIKEEIDSIEQDVMLKEWAKMGFKPDADQMLSTSVYKELKKEFEAFSPDELKQMAYSASSENVSTINAKGQGMPVVKFNPDCWDKSLPTSAIQFISIEYRLASEAELEEFKQSNQGLTDYVGLFFNQLPVEKMNVLIQKK
jgi:hypothetical protein